MVDLLCSCFESDKEDYKPTETTYTEESMRYPPTPIYTRCKGRIFIRKRPTPIDTICKGRIFIRKRPGCINTKGNRKDEMKTNKF